MRERIDLVECQQRIFDSNLPGFMMQDYTKRLQDYFVAITSINPGKPFYEKILRSFISHAAAQERDMCKYYIGCIPPTRFAEYTMWHDTDLTKVGGKRIRYRIELACQSMLNFLCSFDFNAVYVDGSMDNADEYDNFDGTEERILHEKIQARAEKKANPTN